jgi:hypothetical protein
MSDDLNRRIALCYKTPRITTFITEDLKYIKKLNQILIKLEKTDKPIYILESINILSILDNVLDMTAFYPILCELVDLKFHNTLLFLYEKLDEIRNKKNIRKLQGLTIE